MRIDGFKIPPAQVEAFTDAGYWTETTTNEELERLARTQPRKLAIADDRIRLSYEQYFARSQRVASLLLKLGLTSDDVIAIQLPNWTEFAIAVNGAMLAGVPFCQFHSDFRSREVQFILNFTKAAALICPTEFRRFNHLQMVADLQPSLPNLKHVVAVGSDVPSAAFDLRGYLDRGGAPEVDTNQLNPRRPRGNDFARTAFTSGTTGDPKMVLHLHNTTNCALRFLNRGQKLTNDSVLLVFLPVGLNWGLFNILQSIYAGASVILMDTFNADNALETIQRERVTHFCCAPAHLVSLLNARGLADFDLRSLQVIMTGGASCPIEVIRDVQRRMSGHLLEMYGMLECGTQAHTTLTDDPEEVCGTVGRPVPEMGIRVVDENGQDCASNEVGEILTFGPSVTIGYYGNPDANARSFTADRWFRTGDLGVFNEKGYLRIAGRKKEMIIRGGANIYPREIEEVLYQHEKILDAAVIGIPDPRLGEKTCACIVPKPGQSFTFDEMIAFLKPKIATYKLPEMLEVMTDLPRTPTGKIQKGPLSQIVQSKKGTKPSPQNL